MATTIIVVDTDTDREKNTVNYVMFQRVGARSVDGGVKKVMDKLIGCDGINAFG